MGNVVVLSASVNRDPPTCIRCRLGHRLICGSWSVGLITLTAGCTAIADRPASTGGTGFLAVAIFLAIAALYLLLKTVGRLMGAIITTITALVVQVTRAAVRIGCVGVFLLI